MKSCFDSAAGTNPECLPVMVAFDITVGRHTQLDGAVIASTATPDKTTGYRNAGVQ